MKMSEKKCGCGEEKKAKKPVKNQAQKPAVQPPKPRIEETRKG